ncbi:MAG: long-chain fatty acid--CoA ligase [Chromatiales bacterium]|nr:MAG: long-chain fatty acid--CoA ligase [Chromatiales bacterium]
MHGTDDIVQLDYDRNLAEFLLGRLERTPDDIAYSQYGRATRDWVPLTWRQFADRVSCWQQALSGDGLQSGDRVALMLQNCIDWAAFDLAAQGLGLIVVPLYVNDRPDNMSLILQDCGARFLLVGNDEQWQSLAPVEALLSRLHRVVSLEPATALPGGLQPVAADNWLPDSGSDVRVEAPGGNELASIVYTSGTTGRPKGVMLSHRNIVANVLGVLERVQAYPNDVFLSFLPLSHMLERTGGLYLPIASGATVAFARSAQFLAKDFERVRPTVIISVPRVFERIYAKVQEQVAKQSPLKRAIFAQAIKTGWNHFLYEQGRGRWKPSLAFRKQLDKAVGPKVRNAFGGNLRCAVAGGAAIAPEVTKFFIGAGIPILQGYGSTETSPVVAVNCFESNIPESVGQPLADVEVKVGDKDELLTRGPSLMLGYWNNPEATANCIDEQGWFHTGDCARIEQGHVYITGRIKEIIVLGNGEKVPPGDMEMAIGMDELIHQALVIGEGKANLAALVVLEPEEYERFAKTAGLGDLGNEKDNPKLKKILVERVAARLKNFPGYARIPRLAIIDEPWTVESGLLTPTLKPKREKILEACNEQVKELYGET